VHFVVRGGCTFCRERGGCTFCRVRGGCTFCRARGGCTATFDRNNIKYICFYNTINYKYSGH
jgi:hypothetical protein